MLSNLRTRTSNNPLSAPLAHLGTSNSPPSDLEETLARNTIQAMRDSLAVLQSMSLADPKGAATNLEGQKSMLLKSIAAHELIISPLRKLPTELLQVIFQKTYWDHARTFSLPWSLSQAVKGHIPRLSHLHMKLWPPERQVVADMFSIAPQLETVIIDSFEANPGHSFWVEVIVSVRQLTTYLCKPVGRYPRSESINSLATYSNLVHFEGSWQRTVGQLETRITLPRLKVLVIFFSYRHVNSSDGFFEQLILPSISEIIVQGQADGVILPIASMISRSLACNLRTLSITSTTLENSTDILSLLSLTPLLEHLQIRASHHLFAALESPGLLPKLQSLCLAVSDHISLSTFSSRLATFIAMRFEILSHPEAGFRRRALELKFTTEAACRTALFAMQPSPHVGGLDGDVLGLIKSWKMRLVEGIPHLSQRETPQKMFLNNLIHCRRLDQVFRAIERYDIVKSGYLHVRDVLSIPRKISALNLHWYLETSVTNSVVAQKRFSLVGNPFYSETLTATSG
ncbi:hypothetical protein M413DRAFT_12176 [Hebeloma cylindrosporum]|uniref:F-box domain-containing protein n=1 Tax=Hebeloma cylindrosporum TaxID=76867 RepID=A0A0C2YF41_HEBCY|nr:hypothetical protein M413DRAFT_12176 [Hebeloma cylindrosporum h7]